MTRNQATRRTVLRGIGVAVATVAAPIATTARASEDWTAVETPTGNTLHGVEYTNAGAYAVGGGGVVIARTSDGWTKVLDGGPTGNGNDLYGDRKGHTVDGNQTVFYTGDGTTWDRLGIENADYNFYGVDSDGPDDVWVSGGGGSVYHWNGSEWVRDDTGDADLRDVEVRDDDAAGLTVGGGGEVFDLADGRWAAEATPTGENLKALVRGDPDIAVGAGGTVIER